MVSAPALLEVEGKCLSIYAHWVRDGLEWPFKPVRAVLCTDFLVLFDIRRQRDTCDALLFLIAKSACDYSYSHLDIHGSAQSASMGRQGVRAKIGALRPVCNSRVSTETSSCLTHIPGRLTRIRIPCEGVSGTLRQWSRHVSAPINASERDARPGCALAVDGRAITLRLPKPRRLSPS